MTPRDGGNNDGRRDGGNNDGRRDAGNNVGRRDGGNNAVRRDAGNNAGRVVGDRNNGGRVDSRSYNDGRYNGRVAVPRTGPRQNGQGYRAYTYTPRYYYSARYYSYRPFYYYRPAYSTAFAFGYGPRGRGYFYFDSFYNSYVFYPTTIVRYGYYGNYGYPVGELRLDIQPTDAQVYIDGAYAGVVDDFDGVFQSLRLEAGQYHVEVVLPGFETLAFDVQIRPGEKTTYRSDMLAE